MAMENFIPEVWADMLMADRPKEAVIANLAYKGPFLGEIENVGDKLHIAGIGRPTIQTYTKGLTLTTEYMTDTNQDLVIDQAKYFDILVDKWDETEAAGEILEKQLTEARRELVDTQETWLAGFYAQAATTITETELKSSNAYSTFIQAETAMLENNVPQSAERCLVVPPNVLAKMTLSQVVYGRPNDAVSTNGYAGKYLGFNVYVSNNLTAQNTTGYYALAMTRECLALAEQIPMGSVEHFKPQDTFAKAIKALHLYGGTVIRPKDMVTLALTPAAESAI